MLQDTETLCARAAAAIVASRQLVTIRLELLGEMTAIYERRMTSVMKTAMGVRLSEQTLMERYRRLTQADSADRAQ